jgi:poly [ADP-ribose] polymerase
MGLVWQRRELMNLFDYGSNNKFYSVQLIEDHSSYKVFRKWGRVGAAKPQSATETFGSSLDRAKAAFQKRFAEKSGNHWPLEGLFQKKKGKYVLVELADDDEDDDDEEMEDKENDSKQAAVVPDCSLPVEVQDLMELIGDTSLIAQEVSALNFDLKRMPLGRLSKAQISQGYTILQQLSDALTAIDEIENPPAPVVAAPAAAPTIGRTTRRRASAAATTSTAAAASSASAASAK